MAVNEATTSPICKKINPLTSFEVFNIMHQNIMEEWAIILFKPTSLQQTEKRKIVYKKN